MSVRIDGFRDLEIDLAGADLQRPIVTASPGVLPSLAALVTAGTAELVCFGIQHGVQRPFSWQAPCTLRAHEGGSATGPSRSRQISC
jgi:hypothetical protein